MDAGASGNGLQVRSGLRDQVNAFVRCEPVERNLLPKPSSAVWILLLLAAICAVLLWLYSSAAHAQGGGDPTPGDRWLSLAPDTTLETIAVGSCLDQNKPQPIWSDIIRQAPQVMLMIGDNVYGDFKGVEAAGLVAAYRKQAVHPELARARRAFPFLAMWDDHDYGRNDGGGEFEHRLVAARLFHSFWQMQPERASERGIYYSRLFGPPGRRVQIIMLDTRSLRSPLKEKSAAFPHWGRYEPDDDPAKTMLGAEQWTWLEAELAKPAEIRLVISSVQVLADGHGFERWGNISQERDRLVALLSRAGAGTILLSGDRHMGAIYRIEGQGRALYELTASSLNLSYGPSRDARVLPLVSGLFHQENFGLIRIDWAARRLAVSLLGVGGSRFVDMQIAFGEIGGP